MVDDLRRRAADCERQARQATNVAAAVEMMRLARLYRDEAGRVETGDGEAARRSA